MPRQANSSPTGSGYSPENDLKSAEHRAAVVLYIVGLDGSSPDQYELDDVIEKIHTSFYYYPVDENRFMPAHGFFMKKHSAMLKTVYRLAMHTRKLIEGAKENV